MTQAAEGLRSSRRSRDFHPLLDPALAAHLRVDDFGGYYMRLLYDDLGWVIPYRLGREADRFARLVGPDAESVRDLMIAGLFPERHRRSLSDGVRDFIVTATRNLVLFGPPTYEIAYLFENDGSQDARPVQFRLHLIQEGSLGSRNGTPIQYVPAELSGLVDETGLHYVELDPGVLFSLDFDLTSRRAVRQAIEFLHHADGQHDSQFALTVRALQDGGSYDFGQDQIEQSRIFAKATAAIGWNARGLFQAGHLETFDAYREIRFLKFKVQLRELALSTLNEQLRKIGERIGFQASIELVGLPSLEDVERAEEELNAGTRAISDFASLGL